MIQLTEREATRLIQIAQDAKYPIRSVTIIKPKSAAQDPDGIFVTQYADNLSASDSVPVPYIKIL